MWLEQVPTGMQLPGNAQAGKPLQHKLCQHHSYILLRAALSLRRAPLPCLSTHLERIVLLAQRAVAQVKLQGRWDTGGAPSLGCAGAGAWAMGWGWGDTAMRQCTPFCPPARPSLLGIHQQSSDLPTSIPSPFTSTFNPPAGTAP